jgi:hypothetical protein
MKRIIVSFLSILLLFSASCKKDTPSPPETKTCEQLVNELPPYYTIAIQIYISAIRSSFNSVYKDSMNLNPNDFEGVVNAFKSIYNLKSPTTDSLFDGYGFRSKYYVKGNMQYILVSTKDQLLANEIILGQKSSDSVLQKLFADYYFSYVSHDYAINQFPLKTDTITTILMKSCSLLNTPAIGKLNSTFIKKVDVNSIIQTDLPIDIDYNYDKSKEIHSFTFAVWYEKPPPISGRKTAFWKFQVNKNNEVVSYWQYGDKPPKF